MGVQVINSYRLIGFFKALIIFLLYASQGNCAELLGRISDDTATPVLQEPAAVDNKRRIIYRVICAPGGEQLPDCEKPVEDNSSVVEQAAPVETEQTDAPVAGKVQ